MILRVSLYSEEGIDVLVSPPSWTAPYLRRGYQQATNSPSQVRTGPVLLPEMCVSDDKGSQKTEICCKEPLNLIFRR